MENKTKYYTVFGLLLITLLVTLTMTGNTINSDSEAVKIGVVSAQTSGVSAISLPSLTAIELALEDWNSQNRKTKFEIIYEDTEGKAAKSTSSFSKLANVDQVSGIIADITTTTMAIGSIADQTKTPTISYLTTSPIAQEAGDYVFRTSPMNLEGMRLTAQDLVSKDLDQISVITELNDYPLSLKEAFQEEFESLGGSLVFDETYTSQDDLTTLLTKANSRNPEAIVIFVISPRTAVNTIKKIKELGIEIPVYGSENAGTDMAYNIDKKAIEGLIYSSAVYDQEKVQEIRKRFKDKTGNEDVLDWLYVATAYDAAMIFFETIDKVGTNPEDVKEALYNLEDYQGVSGTITFNKYGDPVGAEYGLFQYINGERVRIA
jgi:branched-chain amino acid transport system substrate-binding protein